MRDLTRSDAREWRARGFTLLCAAAPVAFLCAFFVGPIVAILRESLTNTVDASPFATVLGSARTQRAVWFTLWQSGLSTVVACALGLPLAWAVSRARPSARRRAFALIVVPFAMPTVVVAAAITGILGENGSLADLGWAPGWPAIVIAHAFFNVAVVVRVVGVRLMSIDPRLDDAAATLGASPFARFRSILLPLVRPAVLAAAAITFLFCTTSFGVVRVLAGSRYSTVETEIYRLTVDQFRLDRAAALCMVQLAFVALVAIVSAWLQRRATFVASTDGVPAAPRDETPRVRMVRYLVAAPGILLVALPLIVLVIESVSANDGFGWSAYRELGVSNDALVGSPLDAVARSLHIALVASVLAGGLGVMASVAIVRSSPRRAVALEALLVLPLGVSAVTLGYGFLVGLDTPVDLRTSWWLVPIAHALLGLPFVVRTLVPAMRSIDPRLRDAAATLGASPRRSWWALDVPIVRPAFASALGFAAAISLGEFGASSFVARADAPTAPIAIGRLLGRPGDSNYATALALSVVLAVAVGLVVVGTDRVVVAGKTR